MEVLNKVRQKRILPEFYQDLTAASAEGIIDDDVDRSIRNLTVIGADAMCATDSMVLDIMTGKS